MRIGLVEPYDWAVAGGVQRHVAALGRAYQEMGHRVTVIAPCSAPVPDGTPLPPNFLPVQQSIVSLPSNGSQVRFTLSPTLRKVIKTLLRQELFDLIHLHEPFMPGLSLGILHYSRDYPAAVVLGTFHARRQPHVYYHLCQSVFRRMLPNLDGRIAVSEAAKETAARYFPGDYRVIPNGVDLTDFGDAPGTGAPPPGGPAPCVLFVGRLEKRKGFEYLLQAFAQVQAALPAARLVVVGPFTPKESEPFVHQAEDDRLRNVDFVGWVPDNQLAEYYRAADVVCAPSTGGESFGMVLLEAMATGRAVVASDIPGYREVARDGLDGLLVPPKDAGAIATALVRLLRDGALRRRLGDAGRVRSQAFSWDRVAEQVLAYYAEVRQSG